MTALENEFAEALLAGRTMYVSLHTDDPGYTGMNEVIGDSYARSMIGRDGAVHFTNMPIGTVTHIGIWDAVWKGNFLTAAKLAASRAMLKGSMLQIWNIVLARG